MKITVPLRGNGRRQTEPRQRGIVRFTEMPQVVLQFAHFPLGLDIFGVERLRLPCQLLRLGDYHRQIGNDLAAPFGDLIAVLFALLNAGGQVKLLPLGVDFFLCLQQRGADGF